MRSKILYVVNTELTFKVGLGKISAGMGEGEGGCQRIIRFIFQKAAQINTIGKTIALHVDRYRNPYSALPNNIVNTIRNFFILSDGWSQPQSRRRTERNPLCWLLRRIFSSLPPLPSSPPSTRLVIVYHVDSTPSFHRKKKEQETGRFSVTLCQVEGGRSQFRLQVNWGYRTQFSFISPSTVYCQACPVYGQAFPNLRPGLLNCRTCQPEE